MDLLVILFVFVVAVIATVNVHLGWCGRSHLCLEDSECGWFEQNSEWNEKPVGTECCSD